MSPAIAQQNFPKYRAMHVAAESASVLEAQCFRAPETNAVTAKTAMARIGQLNFDG